MQFKASLILATAVLLGLASSATLAAAPVTDLYPRAVEEAAAASYWNVTIYDDAGCKTPNSYDKESYQGTTSYNGKCSPPSFFTYTSVYIGATKGGKCKIAFYQNGGTSAGCTGLVGDPSQAKVGQCYNFDSSNRPTTFNVTCS